MEDDYTRGYVQAVLDMGRLLRALAGIAPHPWLRLKLCKAVEIADRTLMPPAL